MIQVITLLTKDTIDEDINELATSKLRLDDAVAGRPVDDESSASSSTGKKGRKSGAGDDEDGGGGDGDGETENKAKASLLKKLLNKLEAKQDGEGLGVPSSAKIEESAPAAAAAGAALGAIKEENGDAVADVKPEASVKAEAGTLAAPEQEVKAEVDAEGDPDADAEGEDEDAEGEDDLDAEGEPDEP